MLRLVGDENFDGHVIKGLRLREPALDLVRVWDVDLDATPDPIILDWAAGEGRILLSHDRKTMIGHAYDRVARKLPMPGLLMVDDMMSVGDAIEQVLIVAVCYSPAEMKDRVVFLPL